MKNTLLNNPLKVMSTAIKRYNLVLFIVMVVGGLIASIMILNNILTQPAVVTTDPTTSSAVTFDQVTISRLSKLETSANNASYNTLPSARINPFSE